MSYFGSSLPGSGQFGANQNAVVSEAGWRSQTRVFWTGGRTLVSLHEAVWQRLRYNDPVLTIPTWILTVGWVVLKITVTRMTAMAQFHID